MLTKDLQTRLVLTAASTDAAVTVKVFCRDAHRARLRTCELAAQTTRTLTIRPPQRHAPVRIDRQPRPGTGSGSTVFACSTSRVPVDRSLPRSRCAAARLVATVPDAVPERRRRHGVLSPTAGGTGDARRPIPRSCPVSGVPSRSVSPMRRCSRTACNRPAVATLTYVYADSTAVLGPLATYAEPHCYDLCTVHGERLTAPRGWEIVRLAPDPDMLGPSQDDLEALADAVREAARPNRRG